MVAGSYPAGKAPYSVALGDFNGDGTPDLAVAAFQDNSVNVLLGNGDGSFQSPVSYPVVNEPTAVTVGDFNGDGIPDLAVANFISTIGLVSILMGNADGTFQSAVSYNVSYWPISLAVADFNADGIQDLAVGRAGNTVSILLGNGDGTFKQGGDYSCGQGNALGGDSVTVGDFNGDGVQDIAVANYLAGDKVSVLLGNGDGTFRPPMSFYAGKSPEGLSTADLNSDGTLDLVSANYGSGGTGSSVSVLLGNGDGSFQTAVEYDVGNKADAVAVGDWNGDGIPDIAVGNDGGISNTVHTLLGNGDGTFQTADSYDAGKSPHALAVADFNGDGSPDLVTADRGANTVTVLLNADNWDTKPPGVIPPTHCAGAGELWVQNYLRSVGSQRIGNPVPEQNGDSSPLTDLLGTPISAAAGPSPASRPIRVQRNRVPSCSVIMQPNQGLFWTNFQDFVGCQSS
jgi:hypothetical protein